MSEDKFKEFDKYLLKIQIITCIVGLFLLLIYSLLYYWASGKCEDYVSLDTNYTCSNSSNKEIHTIGKHKVVLCVCRR